MIRRLQHSASQKRIEPSRVVAGMSRIQGIICVLIFLILVAVAAYGYFILEINRPAGSGSKKEIVIEKGETVRGIAAKLEEEGLLRSANLFVAYVTFRGLAPQIEAGRYEILPTLSMLQVVEVLRHGSFDIRLTFLEGWRREEYLNYIAKQLPGEIDIFTEEFMTETKELEGYLFPDTYFVAQNISAKELVEILKNNFEKKYAEVAAAVAKQKLTKKQAVILASLVEREARQSEERAIIAGILLKRLELDMPLGVCATVQYALGYQEAEGTWWKKVITNEDTKVSSAYNTYEHVELPSGPICNPGLAALNAVANPQASEYLYYLHDKDGNIHYAETLDKHNQNVVMYLR